MKARVFPADSTGVCINETAPLVHSSMMGVRMTAMIRNRTAMVPTADTAEVSDHEQVHGAVERLEQAGYEKRDGEFYECSGHRAFGDLIGFGLHESLLLFFFVSFFSGVLVYPGVFS